MTAAGTRFLTAREAATLSAVCDAIFPPDDGSAGASDLGVVAFIEAQLDTAWGRGERMYRRGPFSVAAHGGHGWQSRLTPREAYREGLAAVDAMAAPGHAGARFADLPAAARAALLAGLERGEGAGFRDVRPEEFFALVRRNVVEGLFSDPAYGGNLDGAGWRWLDATPPPEPGGRRPDPGAGGM
jgi:gluconate 2-dehydrogenase gamma chain